MLALHHHPGAQKARGAMTSRSGSLGAILMRIG
jgi:hypothetical protein